MRVVEQTLRRQSLFKLLERDIQRPHSVGYHFGNVELILSLRGVKGYPPAADHLHAVGRHESQPGQLAPEHDRREQTALVLERKEQMPGAVGRIVAYFALHPNVAQRRYVLQNLFYEAVKLGYGYCR